MPIAKKTSKNQITLPRSIVDAFPSVNYCDVREEEGPKEVTRRVVLDTNVVVSALLFERGRLSWLRQAWMAGDCRPLVSRATAAEVVPVLAYPKFQLAGAGIEILLGDFLPHAEPVDVPEPGETWAGLRDPDDRIFLDLADAGKAEFLVTGDQDLRSVPPPAACRIVTPAEFRAILGGAP